MFFRRPDRTGYLSIDSSSSEFLRVVDAASMTFLPELCGTLHDDGLMSFCDRVLTENDSNHKKKPSQPRSQTEKQVTNKLQTLRPTPPSLPKILPDEAARQWAPSGFMLNVRKKLPTHAEVTKMMCAFADDCDDGKCACLKAKEECLNTRWSREVIRQKSSAAALPQKPSSAQPNVKRSRLPPLESIPRRPTTVPNIK